MYTCNTLADLTDQTATLTIPGPGSGQSSGYSQIQLKTGGNAVLTMPCCPNIASLLFRLSVTFIGTLPLNDPGTLYTAININSSATSLVGNIGVYTQTQSNRQYTSGSMGGYCDMIWEPSSGMISSMFGSVIGIGMYGQNSTWNFGPLETTGYSAQADLCFSVGAQLNNTTSTATVTVKEFKLTLL